MIEIETGAAAACTAGIEIDARATGNIPAVIEIDTPQGPARAHLHHAADRAAAAVVLGHGAGGGVGARDLVAATKAALAAGCSVALVEQPYRVAGRRSSPPAARLDAAWTAVVDHLRAGPLADLPLIAGGRSAGARVACRTAADTGAVGVLCLAFPLHPPGRPEATRLGELDAVPVPTLIVQGMSDPFGMPPAGPGREVVTVPGNHSLAGDLAAVGAAVRDWLVGLTAGLTAASGAAGGSSRAAGGSSRPAGGSSGPAGGSSRA